MATFALGDAVHGMTDTGNEAPRARAVGHEEQTPSSQGDTMQDPSPEDSPGHWSPGAFEEASAGLRIHPVSVPLGTCCVYTSLREL